MATYKENPATGKEPEELKTSEVRQGARGVGKGVIISTIIAIVVIAVVAISVAQ